MARSDYSPFTVEVCVVLSVKSIKMHSRTSLVDCLGHFVMKSPFMVELLKKTCNKSKADLILELYKADYVSTTSSALLDFTAT